MKNLFIILLIVLGVLFAADRFTGGSVITTFKEKFQMVEKSTAEDDTEEVRRPTVTVTLRPTPTVAPKRIAKVTPRPTPAYAAKRVAPTPSPTPVNSSVRETVPPSKPWGQTGLDTSKGGLNMDRLEMKPKK